MAGEMDKGLGPVGVQADKVVTFPEGLYGFEGLRRFILLLSREDSPWCYVQSLDDETVCFVAVPPDRVFQDYAPEIPAAELARLGLGGGECLLLLLVSLLPDGRLAVNTRAPLVIDPERRLAAQIILPDERLPVRFILPRNPSPEGGGAAGAAGERPRKTGGRRLLKV